MRWLAVLLILMLAGCTDAPDATSDEVPLDDMADDATSNADGEEASGGANNQSFATSMDFAGAAAVGPFGFVTSFADQATLPPGILQVTATWSCTDPVCRLALRVWDADDNEVFHQGGPSPISFEGISAGGRYSFQIITADMSDDTSTALNWAGTVDITVKPE